MPNETLLMRLAGTPSSLRVTLLIDHLIGRICEALSIDRDGRVHSRSRFADLGIDSKRALALKEDLEDDLGVLLPTTLFFDYPTPERVASHLVETVLAFDGTPADPTRPAHGQRPDEICPDDFAAHVKKTFDKYGL